MKVIMFKPRFARLVEAGTKRQTIRPLRKNPIKTGDILSLREWTGLPYRSKQREIMIVDCSAVMKVILPPAGDHWWNYGVGAQRLALDDGFKDPHEMRDWFQQTHGLPFEGVVIYW